MVAILGGDIQTIPKQQGPNLGQHCNVLAARVNQQGISLVEGAFERPTEQLEGAGQVGQALDLGQVELAVVEGAAGEFASFGGSQAVHGGQRGGHGGDDGTAPMDMNFRHVLATEAMRTGHPKHQAMVDRGAIVGIGDRRPPRPPRRRQAPG